MSDTMMDRVFANAVRDELIAEVAKRPRFRPRHVWVGLGILVGLGIVAGGGTAIASNIWRVPGSPHVTTLAPSTHATEVGTATVTVGPAPAQTNDVHLELVCLSSGTFTFPDGASVSCGPTDVGGRGAITTYDMSAKPGQTSITIIATAGARWSLTAGWTISTTTRWGVNANGETYGAQNSNGTPDLIAVEASNGRTGYVFAKQLADADGATASEHFKSPADALAWQKAHQGKSTAIPVYEQDGSTKIGEFIVG